MSASEDSEVDDGPQSSSSFTSHHPAQAQSLAPALDQSSEPRKSNVESGILPDVDNDRDSDESVLPSSDGYKDRDAEQSHHLDNLDELGDPFVAEESYYTRPNRYHGPASTWRSWTKDDRDVAGSLDQERAQDLSIHLYNAHALRSLARKLQGTSSGERRRGTSETDDDGDDIFGVPKVWTAWPLPLHQAPRNYPGSTTTDPRPSRELEECLIGITTEAARERWNSREWQTEEKFKQQPLTEMPHQQIAAASDTLDDGEVPENAVSGSHAYAVDESSPENLDDISDDELYGIDPTAKPIPLADDDKARRLLLPSTRHVISKLDHLLMALHRARQAYTVPIPTSEDDTVATSDTDAERRGSSSSKRRRRCSRGQRKLSVSTEDAEAPGHSSSSNRRKGVWKEDSASRGRKFKGLGLRDWSDVLGMAALTGWDEDIVARASKRCAELFGENMLFRQFREDEHGEKSYFTETLATGEEPLDYGEADLGRSAQAQGTDEDKDSDVERVVNSRYPCRVESCPRYKAPFHTAGNLKQHMTHNHAQFEEENNNDGIPEAAVRDGRQVFCPVQSCRRSREPFMKGSKLYLHVRRMHPEVNVEDLKKLESQRKGETRGKWKGEKRKKNPYERD